MRSRPIDKEGLHVKDRMNSNRSAGRPLASARAVAAGFWIFAALTGEVETFRGRALARERYPY